MSGPRPAGGATSVLGLLREPRWVRGLVLAVAVSVVCVVLGQWQWHRREERLAANAPLRQNYHAAPVEVGQVLPSDSTPLALSDVWTPVEVTGTYDTDATVLVRNRPRDEQAGYEVLVPLVLDDGTALLVDRGWVPAGTDTTRPDTVPAAPDGQVQVLARVRQYESDRPGIRVPAGQVASIGRTAVQEAVAPSGDPRLLGGYALLDSESTASGAALAPAAARTGALAPEPQEDEGPHLAYTVQWYGFALTALVVWVVAGRRELESRTSEGALDAPGTAPDEVAARTPTTPPGAPRPQSQTGQGPSSTPSRRRPVRERPAGRGGPPAVGSDEEAEDAEVDAGRQARTAR